MKIAVLERFADPSRRCDRASVAGPDDELTVYDLNLPRHRVGELLAWLSPRLSIGDRGKLFAACRDTGGLDFAELVWRAGDLLRRVRAGDIEAIACFSAKDFALAEVLAKATGVPCREQLSRQTQYFGEFAFELFAVVPYAYWLHLQGRLDRTVGCLDTRCLYYFSKNHVERPVDRRHVPITEYPVSQRGGPSDYDRVTFPTVRDMRQWAPPPYREAFFDDRFGWQRQICIVSNKTSDEQFAGEPIGSPTNFIATEILLRLIGMLRERYQVIYSRPRAADITTDHQTIRETGDIAAVKQAYPDTMTIQELHKSHPSLGFNELQLRLYSGCQHFISVLGGGAYLASYFGGTNIVLARRGSELVSGAYERWFDRLSGARVLPVGSGEALLSAAEREFLGSG